MLFLQKTGEAFQRRSRRSDETVPQLSQKMHEECGKNHMRVKIIGDPTTFDQDIQDKIRKLEEFSKDYDELYFSDCIELWKPR